MSLAPGQSPHLEDEFCQYASLYREGLNSNSGFYRFLCFFKIIESIIYRRGRLDHVKKVAGEEIRRAHERLPENREALLALLKDVYPWRTEWDPMAIDQIFPKEAWGKKQTIGKLPHDWPYDLGDDPSFYCSSRFQASLTWGVCRPQIRNRIKRCDIVVFFSVRMEKKGPPFEYHLCAVATVKDKAPQSDIWNGDRKDLEVFRNYTNLLIRPKQSFVWEHYEPREAVQHGDWLWRIAQRNGFKKKDLSPIERTNLFANGARINGHRIKIASNYVIFSSDPTKTCILKHPIPVARCYNNGEPECWRKDRLAAVIRRHTIDAGLKQGSKRHSLRTANIQHSHPAIRWTATINESEKWRKEFVTILNQ